MKIADISVEIKGKSGIVVKVICDSISSRF